MSFPTPEARGSYDRAILRLAVPALGALAADPLVSLIDTAFVGRLGPAPLGALGVDSAVFALVFFLFNFLAYGTTPLVGREVGRGRREAARAVVAQAIVVALGLGVAAAVILEWLAGPILSAMGAAGPLRQPALTYLRIRALAAPAVLLVTVGHGAFRGFQDTRTPLVVTLGLNGVNLVLDPLFIFALGWGVAGAAWATVAGQWVGAVWFLVLLRRPGGLPWRSVRLAEMGAFLRVGGQLTLRTFALLATLTLATAVATRVGTVAVAAHQVAGQLWTFLALVVDSLAITAQALVSRYLGAGDPLAARHASDRMLQLGFGLGVLLGAAFWAARSFLPELFTDDPAVLAEVDRVYPFVAAMQPLNALVFVWDGIYMGASRFRYLAGAMLLSALVAGGVLFSVLPFGWGLTGVWWGMVSLMVVRALTLGSHYWWRGGRLERA